MKICIYGAGAIGGSIAGRLRSAGVETSVVARGEHLKAIRANGLFCEAPDGRFGGKLPASDNPADSAAEVKAEGALMGKIVKDANIKIEN